MAASRQVFEAGLRIEGLQLNSGWKKLKLWNDLH
jgi:hypothetical protein